MALGALISAYHQDEAGGLHALFPLAGRTLVEYQARCLAAVGAAPIILLVELMPPALGDAIARLRGEGIIVTPVTNGIEAASRFEAGSELVMLGDGIAPDMADLAMIADGDGALVLTVPDDEAHAGFERIDAGRRWAGLARLDSAGLGATAAMLGDWDLQSTLLRRVIQGGAVFRAARSGDGRGPYLADRPEAMVDYQRRLLVASRVARSDWVSRHLLPLVEEFATEKLMETPLSPAILVRVALGLTLAAALAVTRGWMVASVVLLLMSLPLDLVGQRLAMLRLRPLPPSLLSARLLWPAAGLALLALGWFAARHGAGWGGLVAALTAGAFAEATRIERGRDDPPGAQWLWSRRSAVVILAPFMLAGWLATGLVVAALYAAIGFFIVQHWHHHRLDD